VKLKSKKSENGQVLVITALGTTLFVILFAMVVGIGHLVQAQINLQNAVDLASISGASWQSRYLNQLSQINYRMRQNYKFTLYDLYIVQSRFNQALNDQLRNFNSAGKFDRIGLFKDGAFSFGVCQQTGGFEPIKANPYGPDQSGSGVSGNVDICRNVKVSGSGIPGITALNLFPFNTAAIALNILSQQTVEQWKRNCTNYGRQNVEYFSNYIIPVLRERNKFQMEQAAKLLQQFSLAFNTRSDDIASGTGIADQTIYSTFIGNLIEANKTGEDIQIEYINPPNSRTYDDDPAVINGLSTSIPNNSPSAQFLKYFEINTVNIEMMAIRWELQGANNNCIPIPEFPKEEGLFLGISRKKNTANKPVQSFNVAIRASVKPRLLFWPRSLTPTLTAVAAAKPFGSRIGPAKSQTCIETSGSSNCGRTISANMSFYPGDDNKNPFTNMGGIGHVKISGYLLSLIQNTLGRGNFGGPESRPTTSRFFDYRSCRSNSPSFMCFALAPTLYEGFMYALFPYPNSNEITQFDAARNFSPFDDFGIKAINPSVGRGYLLPDRDPAGVNPKNLSNWHLSFPMGQVSQFRNNGSPAFFADWQSMLSSWSPTVNPNSVNPAEANNTIGRSGYSVKLMSLKQACLESTGAGSNKLAAFCQDVAF